MTLIVSKSSKTLKKGSLSAKSIKLMKFIIKSEWGGKHGFPTYIPLHGRLVSYVVPTHPPSQVIFTTNNLQKGKEIEVSSDMSILNLH